MMTNPNKDGLLEAKTPEDACPCLAFFNELQRQGAEAYAAIQFESGQRVGVAGMLALEIGEKQRQLLAELRDALALDPIKITVEDADFGARVVDAIRANRDAVNRALRET